MFNWTRGQKSQGSPVSKPAIRQLRTDISGHRWDKNRCHRQRGNRSSLLLWFFSSALHRAAKICRSLSTLRSILCLSTLIQFICAARRFSICFRSVSSSGLALGFNLKSGIFYVIRLKTRINTGNYVQPRLKNVILKFARI